MLLHQNFASVQIIINPLNSEIRSTLKQHTYYLDFNNICKYMYMLLLLLFMYLLTSVSVKFINITFVNLTFCFYIDADGVETEINKPVL